MANHQRETDTLPVILGQDLQNVGAKVYRNRGRKAENRWVKTFISDSTEPQTKDFGFCLMEVKRLGMKSKALIQILTLQHTGYMSTCPWANEVLRYYFYLLICNMAYFLLYLLFP